MTTMKLCDERTCTQCGACYDICPRACITRRFTEEGFYIPSIGSNCIRCGLCMKVCPQITPLSQSHPIKTYAAWATDDAIRRTSSSGGVFSILASEVLERGGVVVGAAYKSYLQVTHICIERESDLSQMRGSKYIASDLSGIYKQVENYLKAERPVLFSGTPCQVAALKSFLRKDYDLLVTIDLICHGVPPQRAFDCYLKKIGKNVLKNDRFTFRSTEGWGYDLRHNECKIPISDTYYQKAFSRGYMFNHACYQCRYATSERVGDITLGDFWGLGAIAPFPYDTKKGVNCLLVNSRKGEELLKKAAENLFLAERSLKEAVAGNHNLHAPSEYPPARETFLQDLEKLSNRKLRRKYGLNPTLRDYLRIIKRIAYRHL